MDNNELISVYERLATITEKMARAATDKNWQNFEQLDVQCTRQVRDIQGKKIPPLKGKPLTRKIDLLKQILANDRAIRAATEESGQSGSCTA